MRYFPVTIAEMQLCNLSIVSTEKNIDSKLWLSLAFSGLHAQTLSKEN